MNSRYELDNKFKHKYNNERKYDLKFTNSTNYDKKDTINKKNNGSQEISNKNYKDFYFSKHKHELNKVFSGNLNIIQDIDDFWKFVNKYETVQKKLKISDISSKFLLNTIGVPELYHKLHCINFKLSYNFNELFTHVLSIETLTEKCLLKFQTIIVLYLDFKQKEKFIKLKKLRDSQANLPVYQYKHEIIQSIKQERVVIIAGDTGCGKSTQVPQYLYSAGFQKIGIYNKKKNVIFKIKNIIILNKFFLDNEFLACTQPRRIACISLAKRVAFETLTENYNDVGYQIRFEKQKNQNTKITFITEGLLLRQVKIINVINI